MRGGIGSAIVAAGTRQRLEAAMEAQLQAEITELVRRGDSPDAIQHAVLAPRPWYVDEDERSALWLYAWAESEKRLRSLDDA